MLSTVTVDIGTSSVKLCLFGASGRLLAAARRTTPTVQDAWGEVYDIDALQQLVFGFLRDLDEGHRRDVERIAITGVGESGGLVRADLSLASSMILWHDQRGAGVLDALAPDARSRISRITGLPINPNYGLSKVVWAVEHAGDAVGGAQWLNIAEYLAAVMTGRRWSEYSLASRTMALDLVERRWSDEVCAFVGLDVGVFPELRAASDGSVVEADFARTVGVRDDVRVHVAGHDHMVGAVGAALEAGEFLNSTGTTEGLLFLRDEPSLDAPTKRAKLANGIACTVDEFTLFASIPTGGSAFVTLQSLLGVDAETLSIAIDRIHARYLADDVDLGRIPLVLPQFRGSPPPAKDASARGLIAGLGTDTTDDEVVFGAFLGMVLQFRDVLDLFGAVPQRIKVIGPASRNPLWLQLKADLLGAQLSVSTFPEVVSSGAQALASGSCGSWALHEPNEVLADPARHDALHAWAERIRPHWEYLKGMPR